MNNNKDHTLKMMATEYNDKKGSAYHNVSSTGEPERKKSRLSNDSGDVLFAIGATSFMILEPIADVSSIALIIPNNEVSPVVPSVKRNLSAVPLANVQAGEYLCNESLHQLNFINREVVFHGQDYHLDQAYLDVCHAEIRRFDHYAKYIVSHCCGGITIYDFDNHTFKVHTLFCEKTTSFAGF